MSQWTKVDASLVGVSGDLSHEKTPQGSEGGAALGKVGRGHWYWYANLRDRGEEDAPTIRDWFADLCKRALPTEATLEIDNGYSRYQFEWDAKQQILTLDVPPLYGALQARVDMYEAALRDKFGPEVLERFGEPPDGWRRPL